MRSAVIVFALCAFACFASASHLRSNATMHAKVLSRDNFSATCGVPTLSGSVLSAKCKSIAPGLVDTSLDLNNCFENRNGIFSCGYGWRNSAQDVSLYLNYLSAGLRTVTGSVVPNIIDLNNYLSNINGKLVCDCFRNW